MRRKEKSKGSAAVAEWDGVRRPPPHATDSCPSLLLFLLLLQVRIIESDLEFLDAFAFRIQFDEFKIFSGLDAFCLRDVGSVSLVLRSEMMHLF